MSFKVITTVQIEAPPERVWQVLTDVERWSQWSTLLYYEGGQVRQGGALELRLELPDGGGYRFSPEILVVDPPHHFAWVGRTGLKGIFDGEHHFELEPHGAGGTRLTNRERFGGILSLIMKHLPQMKGTKAGFEAMNAQIKARAEALARGVAEQE